MISLAHASAELGDTATGLALLLTVEAHGWPVAPGILLSQQGLLHLRVGHAREALALLDAAVRAMEPHPETVDLAKVLLNRAALRLGLGRPTPARADLHRCAAIVTRFLDAPAGHDASMLAGLATKVAHSLGYCEMSAGDIPAALRAFDTAADAYRRHADGFVAVVLVDKARALLTAGLARQAERELDEAIRRIRRQRLSQDYGEALLLRADVALALSDLTGAAVWARRAARLFRRRGNEAWSALTALTLIQIRYRGGRAPARLARRAGQVAEALRGLGLRQAAVTSELLAVRAATAAASRGKNRAPAPRLVPASRPEPVQNRLLRGLARAEIAVAAGRRGEALAHLRAGLAVLHDHRSRFGSLDLQTGVSSLGVELAWLGLRVALDAGSPRLVYSWSERTRAQAFRLSWVRPPADPVVAEALAELRQLQPSITRSGTDPTMNAAARRRCAELEAILTDRDWETPGVGGGTAVATFGEIVAELAAADRTMLVLLRHRSRFVGLLVDEAGGRRVDLGPIAVVEPALRGLLAALDLLASPRLPRHVVDRVGASMRRHRAVLTAELAGPLAPVLPGRELVIVPTSNLSTLPWGLLPPFVGWPVSVAPSATAWLAARRSLRSVVPLNGTHVSTATGDRVVLVAGPDLGYADAEVDAVADLHPGSVVLRDGTVEAALKAMDGAAIVHFAAHGRHQPDNVQFSRLQLADGPLMAYDIGQVGVPPRHVVLSSCRLGRATGRPGDELLGFTAALLYAGTPNVVASTAEVLDERSHHLMIAYHTELAAGSPPARALALASLAVPGSPFVCFGAG